MSWARALVRKAAAATDRVLGRGAGPLPPPPVPSLPESGAAAADVDGKSSAASSGPAGAATATATAAAKPKLSPAEEIEKLRSENAKLKHTFQVIKVKLDKTGKATATLEGAGTPAASATTQANQEVRDLIARILAQERERSAAAAASKSQASLSGSTASLGGGGGGGVASPSSAAAVGADAAVSGSVSALSAGIPAPSAPSAGPEASATAATVSATASATTSFESAQREKYGDAKQTAAADGTAVAAPATATATPVAMFYGEDVYASKAEAEAQAGVKLLCYGSVGVGQNGQVVHARDPRYASCVFAASGDELGADEEEVIIVDLDDTKTTDAADDDANWWSVVDNPNPPAARAAAAEQDKADAKDRMKEEPALHLEGPRGTAADGFAIVEEEDMVNAISEYSAQCVRRFPGARAVDPDQLHRLLQTTFAQAEAPSTLGRIWQWGSLAYTGYGWASYAYYLAKQPAVMRGAYTVVRWVLVLVL